MENLHERFSWKVWALLFVGIGLILLLFIIVPLLFSKRTNIGRLQPQPTGITQNPDPAKRISPPIKDTATYSYQNNDIVLRYPSTWQIKYGRDTSGQAVNIRPNGATTEDQYPRIDILIYPASGKITMASLGALLESFGFTKSNSNFFNRQAVKYSYVIPGSKFATGNPLKKDVVKDLYLFETPQNLYSVAYAYYKDTDAEVVRKTILNTVSTLEVR